MSTEEYAQSYTEIVHETFTTVVDALAAANHSSLEYVRGVWEALARPNPDPDALVKLTIETLQANGYAAAELAHKLSALSVKAQESYTNSMRALADLSVSNLTFARDTTAEVLRPPAEFAVSNN